MLIDHIGAVFVPRSTTLYLVMRCIGRLAFPIFVFLLVEGFYHTRDVKKYLLRLGAFAFLSEIPFDLAFFGKTLEFTHQNIFFTLFLGLACMYLMSRAENAFRENVILMNLFRGALILIFCLLAYYLKTDYDYRGVLIIIGFYLFRGNKVLLTATLLFVSGYLLGYINGLATFAIIPLAFYDGKKGKSIKYAFYIFYPAHLLVLAFIKIML